MKKNSFLISNNVYGVIVVNIIVLVLVAIMVAHFTYH
jgi:cytochrome c oxidase subunit IV